MPLRLHFLAIVTLSALVVTATSGCSRNRPTAGPGRTTTTVAGVVAVDATTTTGAPAVVPVVSFSVSSVYDNQTTGPDEAITAAVRTTLDGWLVTAVLAPLHSGRPAGDLAPLFTAAALGQLADPVVRSTLVDEGLPAADKNIGVELADTSWSTVAGADGVVGLVAVRLDFRARAVGASLDVDVVHQGDLVLVPEGGAWKIDAFSMHSTHDTHGRQP